MSCFRSFILLTWILAPGDAASEQLETVIVDADGAADGAGPPLLACVGTLIEQCPLERSEDPCASPAAGSCVNVWHACNPDMLKQCKLDKDGNCASAEDPCYLECTGKVLEGGDCDKVSLDQCKGGYVSDGSAGMACIISAEDRYKCEKAGACALPQK
eukprot:gb/GFBE01013038.1/.p1 GENE.gb/GFBE01013038.1/~~gb/GFBE01013038.1/.p1  ORF type:complete len:158 (+),score=31.81 gb/GFBE01013038.1/:1-474(+)